jgi:hypothetical protein
LFQFPLKLTYKTDNRRCLNKLLGPVLRGEAVKFLTPKWYTNRVVEGMKERGGVPGLSGYDGAGGSAAPDGCGSAPLFLYTGFTEETGKPGTVPMKWPGDILPTRTSHGILLHRRPQLPSFFVGCILS